MGIQIRRILELKIIGRCDDWVVAVDTVVVVVKITGKAGGVEVNFDCLVGERGIILKGLMRCCRQSDR